MGSEDFDIRVFKDDEIICEMSETEVNCLFRNFYEYKIRINVFKWSVLNVGKLSVLGRKFFDYLTTFWFLEVILELSLKVRKIINFFIK